MITMKRYRIVYAHGTTSGHIEVSGTNVERAIRRAREIPAIANATIVSAMPINERISLRQSSPTGRKETPAYGENKTTDQAAHEGLLAS